ncbi:MAG: N-acetyltransferase family protein [Pseudomonadota bacterium]
MTHTIRAATVADAAGILPIYNRLIRDTTVTFLPHEKTEDEIAEAISKADTYLVAIRAGVVTGFASFGPFRAGAGYASVKEHSICLDEKVRGSGLGARLLDALESEARAQGVRVMVAGISGENGPGQRFHARQGYQQVGLMPAIGEKFGRRLDLVLMQKSL